MCETFFDNYPILVRTALTFLNIYFEPLKNRAYEGYKFRQASQAPQETIDQFHTRLRGLGETCEFHDLDFEIMLQIVLHGTSSHLRNQALPNNSLTLQQLLLLCRQDEMSRFQAADIEGKGMEDAISKRKQAQIHGIPLKPLHAKHAMENREWLWWRMASSKR